MRKSLCFYIMVILPVLILGGNTNQYKPSQKNKFVILKNKLITRGLRFRGRMVVIIGIIL